MKRLLLLVLVALGVAGYFFRDQVVPVVAPFLPQAVMTLMSPAASNAPHAEGQKDGMKPGGKRGGGGPQAVLVASAKTGSLPILRQAVGTVIPAANTSLASQTPGFVLDISVKDGATVKAGDLLFSWMTAPFRP